MASYMLNVENYILCQGLVHNAQNTAGNYNKKIKQLHYYYTLIYFRNLSCCDI